MLSELLVDDPADALVWLSVYPLPEQQVWKTPVYISDSSFEENRGGRKEEQTLHHTKRVVGD
jgi:hypothetical protein